MAEYNFMNRVEDIINKCVNEERELADVQRKHIRALENVMFNDDGSISGAKCGEMTPEGESWREPWLVCADNDTVVFCSTHWQWIPEDDPRRKKTENVMQNEFGESIYVYDFDDIKAEVKREMERYESRAALHDKAAAAIPGYVMHLAEACHPLFEAAADTGTDDVDVAIALKAAGAEIFTLLKRDMFGLYDDED